MRKIDLLDTASPRATILTSLSIKSCRFSVGVGARRYLYLSGGYSDVEILREAHEYDIVTNRWSRLPNLLKARECHSSVVIADTLYIMGGIMENGGISHGFDDIECIKPRIEMAWRFFLRIHKAIVILRNAFAISSSEVCLVGGANIYEGCIVNLNKKSFRKFMNKDLDLQMTLKGSPQIQWAGRQRFITFGEKW